MTALRVGSRITTVEGRRIMDRLEARAPAGYARLYGLLAVVSVVLSAQSWFAPDDGGQADERSSMWTALTDGPIVHVGAEVVILAFVVLCGLLLAGTLDFGATLLRLCISVAALLLGILVLSGAGASDKATALTNWGQTVVVVCFATAVLGIVNAVHLWAVTGRPEGGWSTQQETPSQSDRTR